MCPLNTDRVGTRHVDGRHVFLKMAALLIGRKSFPETRLFLCQDAHVWEVQDVHTVAHDTDISHFKNKGYVFE